MFSKITEQGKAPSEPLIRLKKTLDSWDFTQPFNFELEKYDPCTDMDDVENIFQFLLDRWQSVEAPLTISINNYPFAEKIAERLGKVLSQRGCKNLALDFRNSYLGLIGTDVILNTLRLENYQHSAITLQMDPELDEDERVFIVEKIENFIQSDQGPPQLKLGLPVSSIARNALMDNTSITILLKPEDQNSDTGKWINLINARNELLKKYPEFRNVILHFCSNKNFYYATPEEQEQLLHDSNNKNNLPAELQDFFDQATISYREALHHFFLERKDTQGLRDLACSSMDEDSMAAFLSLPFEKLMANDLLILLYQHHKKDPVFKANILSLLGKNVQPVKASQSVSLRALWAALNNDEVVGDNLDYISVCLLACHYSEGNAREKWYKKLENLNLDVNPVSEMHLILAEKIQDSLHTLLSNQFYKKNPLENPESLKKIQFMQSAIRIKNRTQDVYPILFNLPREGVQSSYSFWSVKPKDKLFSLKKPLSTFAMEYAKQSEMPLSNGKMLVFIKNLTSQYVRTYESLENIMDSAYILSQEARHKMDMGNYQSLNNYEDQLIKDHQLIFTAPLNVVAAISYSTYARINFDLSKMPAACLQHCVIKMADYPSRALSVEIALTDSIRLQLMPHTINECTLLKMSSPPGQMSFDKLPLEPGINAYILYNDELFYADRRNQRVTPILIPDTKLAEFNQIKSKFSDAPARMHPNDIDFFNSVSSIKQTDRSQSSYRFYNDKISYTLTLPGTDELFHGIEGFKEAMLHFLFVVNALPDEGEGKVFKDAIIGYLDNMNKQGQLQGYLNWVFEQLFKYMEIDFPYGLPFSLDYVHSIQFGGDARDINFQTLLKQAAEGDIQDPGFFQMLDFPPLIHQILKAVPAELLPQVAAFIEEQHPRSYIFAINKLPELLRKNLVELKTHVNKMAETSVDTQYDLWAMLSRLRDELSNNPELRLQLIDKHKATIAALKEKLIKLYENFAFAGGESKLRELFSNPETMRLLIGENCEVIAAILALDLEAEFHKNTPSPELLITTVISQRTQKEITITLNSLLFAALKQPVFFLESYPVNTQFDFRQGEPWADYVKRSTKNSILTYAKQKMIFKHIYTRLEQGIVNLCQKMSSRDFCLDSYSDQENGYEYNPLEWERYASEIRDISFIKDDFCQNPSIVNEINSVLSWFPDFVLGRAAQKPTLDTLVNAILNSSALLNPALAHLLFDSTHYPVALQGKGVNLIPLADHEFKRVLKLEKEPSLTSMREYDLATVLSAEGQLTIYWLQEGKLMKKSFDEDLVQSIVNNLPAQGQESTDMQLIQAINAQYACAPRQISFHDLIIACMDNIAKNGVNSSNALMAEQLSLRLKKLQFDFGICNKAEIRDNLYMAQK